MKRNPHKNTKKYTRYELLDWKHEVKKTQNTCYVSGSKEELEIHHLSRPFSEIFQEALHNLNLPYHKDTEDYTQEELDALSGEVLRLHESVIALALRKDIHKDLHKIYGLNFTMDQVEEYKKSFKGGR